MFAVPTTVIGECEPFENRCNEQLVRSMTQLDVDALSIWQDQRFADALASSETRIIFLGGGWLEEEVFIAALQGAEHGYDVRVLSDVVVTHVQADRPLVFDRLALHGILATTVRQTLLEWAVYLNDPLLKKKVQQLLL
jgi:nicotinamidase-related amidase